MRKIYFVSFLLIIVFGCSRYAGEVADIGSALVPPSNPYLYAIPPSPQREGDPVKGKKYLLEGDYLDSGFPVAVLDKMPILGKGQNELKRTGRNADLPPTFTATTAHNGVDIVAPNCLICHGANLMDDYIIGLGNYAYDGTSASSLTLNSMGFMVKNLFSEDSPEWAAFEQFFKSTLALNGKTLTETVGANSADKITEVLLAHRQLPSLAWSEEELLEVSNETVPADPPAWWLLKKKNAQFTTGIGQGDFARISTASSLLTMQNVEKVKEIDEKFVDVIAYIKSIEPPEYPQQIDPAMANEGAMIFDEKCSKCHGTYGEQESYPNYQVHLNLIKTDPVLAQSYSERQRFVDMYNGSWFGQGEHGAYIVPGQGYVAPPLDGVWATAPYLHNGSVPTIMALLDSGKRPKYWKREFGPKKYDFENLGWQYEEKESKLDKYTYDTTQKGYGNQGHYFGDRLNDAERLAVVEYLKTL